jgi:hypothetical protein
MRLSYCGAHYETELPTFQMLEGDVIGKHRGANLRLQYSYPKHIPMPQTPLDRKHQGANATPAAITTLSQSTPQNVRQRVLKEVEETHRTNIYRSLERRLQVAKNLGDQRLVGLLESELQQLV